MFAILTDCTAYFTKEEAFIKGINIIPMTYTIGNNRYFEHFSENNDEILDKINQNLEICKTSQPNISNYEDAFKKVVDLGISGLFISISSRLSGAYNSAELVAKGIGHNRIKVIDSRTVAGGLRLLVEKAITMRAQGCSLDETYASCLSAIDKIGMTFSVDNMDALRRGGRIGVIKHSISTVLNIRPILEIKDGVIVSIGTARGANNIIKSLCAYIPDNVKRIFINCFYESNSVLLTKQYLAEKYPAIAIVMHYLGPTLAIHLGKEGFGVAWQAE